MPQQQDNQQPDSSQDIVDVDLSDLKDVDLSDLKDENRSVFSRGWEWGNTPIFQGSGPFGHPEPTPEEWMENPSIELSRRSAWAQATTPFNIAGEILGTGAIGYGIKRLLGRGAGQASEAITSLGSLTGGGDEAVDVAQVIAQAPRKFNRGDAYKELIAFGEDPNALRRMKNADMEALLARRKQGGNVTTVTNAKGQKIKVTPDTRFEDIQILVNAGGDIRELGRKKTEDLRRMVDALGANAGGGKPPGPVVKLDEIPMGSGGNKGAPPAPPGGPPGDTIAFDDLPEAVPPVGGTEKESWFNAVNNAARASQASFDFSFPFRQGAGYTGRKPWRDAWGEMRRAGWSDEAAQALEAEMRQRDLFKPVVEPMRGKSGKVIIDKATGQPKLITRPSFAEDAGLDLLTHEEYMKSDLIQKIWGVRRGVNVSNRAYAAFANKVRADAFEELVDRFTKLGVDPRQNMEVARHIAQMVNTGTGRGSLKILDKNLDFFNKILFSPKFMASRINMFQNAFNPQRALAAAKGDIVSKELMKEAWKQLGSVTGTWATIAMLSNWAGAEVNMNPLSSDFGKVKINGRVRLDFGSGLQQYMVLPIRIAMGQQTSSTNESTYTYGSKYGLPTMRDAVTDFGANRLAPLFSLASKVLDASNKRPVSVFDNTIRTVTPFTAQTLMEVLQEDPGLIPIVMPPAIVGAGVQIYDERGQGHPLIPGTEDFGPKWYGDSLIPSTR